MLACFSCLVLIPHDIAVPSQYTKLSLTTPDHNWNFDFTLAFLYKKKLLKNYVRAAYKAAPNLTINSRSRICDFSVCFL